MTAYDWKKMYRLAAEIIDMAREDVVTDIDPDESAVWFFENEAQLETKIAELLAREFGVDE